MAGDASITHVSDTALWVATFRAQEGQRADAAFDDPLASLLAGERGRSIARSIPRAAMVAWSTVIRTSSIDRLIGEGLAAGVDTVLNLGAGMDTRPYRMKLPAALRWIEVDFPSLVSVKDSTLRQQTPGCRLERIGLDLLDLPARAALFADYGAASKNMLVITEGVIPYFSAAAAAGLAREMHAVASLRAWIQDFDNAGQRAPPRGWEKKLKAAPFLFDARDWFDFFREHGWRPLKTITNSEESQRIKRPYPLDFPFGVLMRALPRDMSAKILSLSGATMLQK